VVKVTILILGSEFKVPSQKWSSAMTHRKNYSILLYHSVNVISERYTFYSKIETLNQ